MDLWIIRHGESEADRLNVIEGRADFSLTDTGRQQAGKLARWMLQYPIDYLYASPLKRAKETAEILGNALGLPVQFDPDLMEFQNGLIAGLPREEANAKYPEPLEKYPHTALYGMESQIAFRMRAETALSKLLHEHPIASSIAVISHGGMIRMLYHAFLGLPVDARVSFHSGDTAVHHWQVDARGKRIVMANAQVHLLT